MVQRATRSFYSGVLPLVHTRRTTWKIPATILSLTRLRLLSQFEFVSKHQKYFILLLQSVGKYGSFQGQIHFTSQERRMAGDFLKKAILHGCCCCCCYSVFVFFSHFFVVFLPWDLWHRNIKRWGETNYYLWVLDHLQQKCWLLWKPHKRLECLLL